VHKAAFCVFFLFLICLPIEVAAADRLPSCLTQNRGESAEAVFKKTNIAPPEILARLVYAEALSTDFGDDPLVFRAIAWGVMNRVRLADISKAMRRAFGQGIYGVIFKKGQFNPAISRKSPFHTCFLCPDNAGPWQMAVAAADEAIGGENNPFIYTPWEKKHGLSLVVNFYYPKSVQAKGPLPPWEGCRDLVFIGDAPLAQTPLSAKCIRFYRLAKPPADLHD
jgi:hypothetical protein